MNRYPKNHFRAILTISALLALTWLVLPNSSQPEAARKPVSLAVKPLPPKKEATKPKPKTTHEWKRVEVKKGDSLSLIFDRLGLGPTQLHTVLKSGPEVASLRRITPGQVLEFQIGHDSELLALRYQRATFESVEVRKLDNGFRSDTEIINPEIITSFTTAIITAESPSLYHAGKKAGLSDKIIMQLANVFQWDVSFALDLRQGDAFTLIYEEFYVDGEKVKEGDILAAQFRNMGKDYIAVLYEDANGGKSHYTPDGRSLKKAFIRDPVHFSHVSSSFNLRRLHPIHKRVMPHRGIDYAAKKGTPVIASGDGKVTIARQNNASGKYVVVQHGEQYTTKYLHLSAFARGTRVGKSVKQGQVIGYVGATGWATAPHLHYEFLVNGVHRNPRTVTLPKANPIHQGELARFKSSTSPMLIRLASVAGETNFATNSNLSRTDKGG